MVMSTEHAGFLHDGFQVYQRHQIVARVFAGARLGSSREAE
jgi:hypothetical protein